jgi:hypothetical protein
MHPSCMDARNMARNGLQKINGAAPARYILIRISIGISTVVDRESCRPQVACSGNCANAR